MTDDDDDDRVREAGARPDGLAPRGASKTVCVPLCPVCVHACVWSGPRRSNDPPKKVTSPAFASSRSRGGAADGTRSFLLS